MPIATEPTPPVSKPPPASRDLLREALACLVALYEGQQREADKGEHGDRRDTGDHRPGEPHRSAQPSESHRLRHAGDDAVSEQVARQYAADAVARLRDILGGAFAHSLGARKALLISALPMAVDHYENFPVASLLLPR